MSDDKKSDGLMVGILIVLGAVLLAGLGVGSLVLRRYQFGREQERRAVATRNLSAIRQAMEELVTIVGEVEGQDSLPSETPVHACRASVADPRWIVRFKVLERGHGNYSFEVCNILVHSPSEDLGVQTPGQKLRLRLRVAKQPPQIVAPTEDTVARIQFADSDGILELISYDAIE
jgi:hypothetical protein